MGKQRVKLWRSQYDMNLYGFITEMISNGKSIVSVVPTKYQMSVNIIESAIIVYTD